MNLFDIVNLAINLVTAGGIGFLAYQGGKWVGRLETAVNGQGKRLDAHDDRLTYLERRD